MLNILVGTFFSFFFFFFAVENETITGEQSLQFDFDTLQDATNNFSDDNKIGSGGFGNVYKVELYKFWFIIWHFRRMHFLDIYSH